MKRPLLIVGSALLGLAAGFGLRAWRQPHAAASATPESSATSSVVVPGPPPKLTSQPSSALAETLEANLSLTDGVTRWLHWMTAVEKAGPKDFPSLARLAQSLPGALNMLAARWIDRDPHGLFEACRNAGANGSGFPANELAQQLFQAWPKNDPDAVLAALQEHRNLANGWQFTALNTLFQNRPEQALITMSQLDITSYGPNMGGIATWAAADPRHAAEIALTHPAGYATWRVLETIGKEWAKSDPSSALSFAMAHESGPGAELANHVIRQWVEKDIGQASDWFAAADETARARLLPAFVEAWGKQDAATALQWCLDHTTGRQQTDVVQSLIKGSLAQNQDTAAAMVIGLEASPLRARAAVTFAEAMLNLNKGSWWPGIVSSEADRKAKPEALAWLGQLDPLPRREVLSRIAWSWSESDPRGFAEFLRTPAGQDASPEALAAAARSLVRQQPQEALEWAAQAPENIRQRTLADTFQNWTRTQPEAAMIWLDQLPASDPRRETFYLGAVESAIPPSAFQDGPLTSLDPINTARQNLARLLANDPAAARRRIEELPVSGEERSRILGQLRLDKR